MVGKRTELRAGDLGVARASGEPHAKVCAAAMSAVPNRREPTGLYDQLRPRGASNPWWAIGKTQDCPVWSDTIRSDHAWKTNRASQGRRGSWC